MDWCEANCLHIPPYCPSSFCRCSSPGENKEDEEDEDNDEDDKDDNDEEEKEDAPLLVKSLKEEMRIRCFCLLREYKEND